MIREYLAAGYPIIAIQTYEPERAQADLVNEILTSNEQCTCFTWNILKGINALDKNGLYTQQIAQGGDPLAVLDWLTPQADNTVVFLWNYHRFLSTETIQAIQNGRDIWKSKGQCIIMLVPDIQLPKEIEKSVTIIDFNLPGESELNDVAKGIAVAADIKYEEDSGLINAARGMTLFEAENALSLSFAKTGGFDPLIVSDLKLQTIKKSGFMELYKPVPESELGGLSEYKKYVHNRKKGFYDPNLPKPKAILLFGLPGGGKSLSAKVAASVLGFPLIRLDIQNLKGSRVGESEQNTKYAWKLIKAVSPCVVWCEEVEKIFSGVKSSGQSDAGTTSSMFGIFLTEMQECTESVYFVMTCNDIDELLSISQGALIRRFDDIFFVDLPTPEERRDILAIMNKRYKTNHSTNLVSKMEGWTGAEIEKFCKASIFDGAEDAFTNIKPIYQQNRTQIEKAREWARANSRWANKTQQAQRETRKVRSTQPI